MISFKATIHSEECFVRASLPTGTGREFASHILLLEVTQLKSIVLKKRNESAEML
jgi:hypothetical protein